MSTTLIQQLMHGTQLTVFTCWLPVTGSLSPAQYSQINPHIHLLWLWLSKICKWNWNDSCSHHLHIWFLDHL